MIDWGMIGGVAAVVSAAAIPLVLSPAFYKLLYSVYRWFIRLPIISSKGLCSLLVWDDIAPQGYVHECQGNYSCCMVSVSSVHGAHNPQSKCWLSTLGVVFTQAWMSPARQHKTVQKPDVLPLNRNYVCTDARTILGFILCSVQEMPYWARDSSISSRAGTAWSPENLRFGGTFVETDKTKQLANGTVVVHLEGSLQQNLTKGDIKGLLVGYPPWYRESVCMPHGPIVPHPIKSLHDINRAGWVVAVGLSDAEPLPAVPWDGELTKKPIRRTYDVIEGRLRPAFPNDVKVMCAAEAVGYLVAKATESGVKSYLGGDFYTERSDTIQKLSKSEATFAMKLFNEPPNMALTAEDIAELEPILLPVVDAAFCGAHRIVALLKNQPGKSFYWPKLLQDPKRRIFVEDCAHRG
ncbi:unnamed protein product [Calypogeia fissa]